MIEAILGSLEGVKPTGRGFLARCPCPDHKDRNPSLSISQAEDGRILVYCFANCSIQEICEALSIKPADLFPDTGRMNPEAKRQYSEAEKQRKLKKRFDQLCNEAFVAMVEFRDLTESVYENLKLDVDGDVLKAVHMLPMIENYLEILAIGKPEDKLELLRSGVIQKWAKLYNSQKMMKSLSMEQGKISPT